MEDKSGDKITGLKPRGIRRQYVNKNGEGNIMMLVSDMSLAKDYPNYGYRKWLEIYAADEEKLKKDFHDAFLFATEMGWRKPSAEKPYDENSILSRCKWEWKKFVQLSVYQMVDKVCGTELDKRMKERNGKSKKIVMPQVGKPYTICEVEAQINKDTNAKNALLVVINGQVCDLSNFISKHPGGKQVIMDQVGKIKG